MSAPSRSRLFLPWIVLGTVCLVLMCLFPGGETVPYHLAWIGLALAYGIEAWPWVRTVCAVTAFTLTTGAVLVFRASTEVIGWGETAEIPLMSILVLLVLWNVRRRHLAYGRLSRLAERDRLRAAQRERLSRMTSHEMRTPATIALGYTDMLLRSASDERVRSDLRVISDELRRLVLVSDRVVRTIRMHDQDELRVHYLPTLLSETSARWGVVADRDWVVECQPIRHFCSAGRLRACLDTLVENALRYTEDGDTVRLFGRLADGMVLIGVADSGVGLDPVVLSGLNSGATPMDETLEGVLATDPKSQTGLGLALVREAAEARGGYVVGGVSAEGGALVTMVVPHQVTRTRAGRPSVAAPSGHAAPVSVPV